MVTGSQEKTFLGTSNLIGNKGSKQKGLRGQGNMYPLGRPSLYLTRNYQCTLDKYSLRKKNNNAVFLLFAPKHDDSLFKLNKLASKLVPVWSSKFQRRLTAEITVLTFEEYYFSK